MAPEGLEGFLGGWLVKDFGWSDGEPSFREVQVLGVDEVERGWRGRRWREGCSLEPGIQGM